MGELPAQVAASAPDGSERPFSVYLHVPYCRVRCGYCDFNTYTNLAMGQGASAKDFVGTLAGEVRAVGGAALLADAGSKAAGEAGVAVTTRVDAARAGAGAPSSRTARRRGRRRSSRWSRPMLTVTGWGRSP